MDNHPLHKIVSRFVDVRRDEFVSSLFLFFYFFLVTASAYIIKPVKISLFGLHRYVREQIGQRIRSCSPSSVCYLIRFHCQTNQQRIISNKCDEIRASSMDSPEVLRYALESAGKLKKREFVPIIIAQLKNPDISSGTKKSIDYSCELLDNILKKELRDCIFPLIDDILFDEKVKRCRKMLKDLEKAVTS